MKGPNIIQRIFFGLPSNLGMFEGNLVGVLGHVAL
jgi:hypothetical protein